MLLESQVSKGTYAWGTHVANHEESVKDEVTDNDHIDDDKFDKTEWTSWWIY